jgi:hypothetical protein
MSSVALKILFYIKVNLGNLADDIFTASMQFMIDNSAKKSVEDWWFEMTDVVCVPIIYPVIFSLWHQDLKWNPLQLAIHLTNHLIHLI